MGVISVRFTIGAIKLAKENTEVDMANDCKECRFKTVCEKLKYSPNYLDDGECEHYEVLFSYFESSEN